MTSDGRRGGIVLGDLLSALGAVVLLVTLWRPWYELRFPDEVLNQAQAFATRMGDLAPFAQQGVDQLRAQGSVPLTAWQVFDGADVAIALAAGAVLGLFALNAIGALSSRMDGAVVLAGLVATAVVAFRLLSPPGGNSPMAADLLHTASAAKVALGASVLMVVGAVVAQGRGTATPASASPAAVPATVAAHDIKVTNAS